MILTVYLICHIPAIIMLSIGFAKRKTKPQTAKVLFILSGVYFIIGAGICGNLF